MVTLTATNPTLLDWKQALAPDNQSIATVIEMLHEVNEVLADITYMEGNLVTGNKTTVRTGLPAVTWRKLYGGVQPDKSRRDTIMDTCAMLEAYNEVDKALADLADNANEFRLSEATAQIESFAQAEVDTFFYGNVVSNPERFQGLANRYNSLSAENADNIINANGSSNNRSIWLIGWGPQTCFGIVPKGSAMGLQVRDLGEVTIENADGSNGRMQAYRMHFRKDVGLCLKDWRYVVRIANIDKSALTATAASGPILPDLMFEAIERLPSTAGIRPVFYMSRDLRTKFRQQLASLTKQSTLEYQNVGGHRAMMFNDIPIRRCDALAVDETTVS